MRTLLVSLFLTSLASGQDLNWSFDHRVSEVERKLDQVIQRLDKLEQKNDRPKRIQVSGLWYDVYPDGQVKECKECNAAIRAEIQRKQAQPVQQVQTVREVPSVQTFPSGLYNPTHTCPKCGHTSAAGTGTWVVRGFNADGTHTHVCPVCGLSWRH